MRIVFEPLPVWRGGMLAAEYDAPGDIVRVNSEAIARVRTLLGDESAQTFIACALAHERFHRTNPRATEAQAQRYARTMCGDDPERFAAALRD